MASQKSGTFDPFETPDTIQLWTVEDPYPYLAEARRRHPVLVDWPLPDDLGDGDIAADEDQWLSVLGHDEVMTVLRDNETYSSAVLVDLMGPVLDGTMVAMDEPEHRAHRALVAPAFRPKLLAHWREELVERVIDELVDSFAEEGRADLVRRLTFLFPVRVIARILGLSDRDSEEFQRRTIEVISIIVDWDRGVAAGQALREYFAREVAARRRQPRDDLISDLIDTEVDGERLDDEEIFNFLLLLLPAGVETTYRSFGNLLFALLTHPEQLDDVVRDADLRGPAIEEALRWEPPLLMVPRRAVRDTRLAGIDVRAGQGLNVFIGAANRDERHYDEPDRFDIHRDPKPHVSFGSGPHMCLGMHLARMETRVALDAVLDRLPNLTLDPDEPRPRIVGSVFRSPDALPVRFG